MFFHLCSISIPVLLFTDSRSERFPLLKKLKVSVPYLHIECPFDGNQGAHGWQILQESEELWWRLLHFVSLLSFPFPPPFLLLCTHPPLLHPLWLLDNAPQKTSVVAECSCETGWMCERVCVRSLRVWCVSVCAHKLTLQSVSCRGTLVLSWHRLTVSLCVFRHLCVCKCVFRSALTWHSNHLTCLVITIRGKGCWEFPGRGVTDLTTPLSCVHSFIYFPSQTPNAFTLVLIESSGLQQRWKGNGMMTTRIPNRSDILLNTNNLIPCLLHSPTLHSLSNLHLVCSRCTFKDVLSCFLSIYVTLAHPAPASLSLSVSPGFWNLMRRSRVIGNKRGGKRAWKEDLKRKLEIRRFEEDFWSLYQNMESVNKSICNAAW